MIGGRQGGQGRIDEQGRIDDIADAARDFALQVALSTASCSILDSFYFLFQNTFGQNCACLPETC